MRSKSQSNETAAPQQKKGKAGKVILTIVAILLGLAVGVGGFVYWYAKRLIVDNVTFVTFIIFCLSVLTADQEITTRPVQADFPT